MYGANQFGQVYYGQSVQEVQTVRMLFAQLMLIPKAAGRVEIEPAIEADLTILPKTTAQVDFEDLT